MIIVSEHEFRAFAAQGYNHIPVAREVLADLDTPLSAYMKLAGGPRTFLLESVQGGEKWGRYSMIGLAAKTAIQYAGGRFTISADSKIITDKVTGDPFTEIANFQAQFRVPPVAGLPRFTGGLTGYFGYECVHCLEPRLGGQTKADPLQCPDLLLLVADRVLVFDNLSGKALIIVHADPSAGNAYQLARQDLDTLAEQLRRTAVDPAVRGHRAAGAGKSGRHSMTQATFSQGVRRIKDYIRAGDAMQVVLSQRLSMPFEATPLDLYRALRSTNPSPYMYLLNFGAFQVVGASPEILARLEEGTITVRPIAGTRRRGVDADEDRRLEQELLADAKELAEHLMMIDLGRNDVGRIAETGTVQLTERMGIERYSHVMHIVSQVTGRLQKDTGAIDVLRATFPAGTVSGAPKVRAMEIIAELEPVRRGVYSGAVGYLSWAGNMDTAIAIRTAVIQDGELHVQAGAGIVADSDADREWEETLRKAQAVVHAAELVQSGLHERPTDLKCS